MNYQRVIITGASSGFGAEFARRLAPDVRELVLIARRRDRMETLAHELAGKYGNLAVDIRACDLSLPEERHSLIDGLMRLSPARTLLINNAGLGDYGELSSSDAARNRQMLEVNICALTELCRAFAPVLAAHGGDIINISSLGALLPIPDFAIYAASKAYVSSFSEALRLELKASGVGVLAVCPGPVHTEFGAVARREGFTGNMTPGKDLFDTDVETVISSALRGIACRKACVYPSFKITCLSFLLRMMPLPVIRMVMGLRPRKISSDS